jgi:hypothetical protein
VLEAKQIEIHIMMPGGISNYSSNTSKIAVVCGDDIQLITSSSVSAKGYYVWPSLTSGSCGPTRVESSGYDHGAFVLVIRKSLDKLTRSIKEEWMWLSNRIGIAEVVHVLQKQLLRGTILLNATS